MEGALSGISLGAASGAKAIRDRLTPVQQAFMLADRAEQLVRRVASVHAEALGGLHEAEDSRCGNKPANAVLPDLAEQCESACDRIGYALNLLDALERELSK